MSGDVRVEVIDTRAGVEALCGPWRALVERSGANRAFASPEWFSAALTMAPWLRVHVIAAFDGAGDAPVAGLLPLALDRRTETLGFATDLSDTNDLIAPTGGRGVAATLVKHITGRGPDRGRVLFSGLRPDAVLQRVLAPDLPRRVVSRCPYVDVRAGYDAYLATRSAGFRSLLRRRMRAATRAGLDVCEVQPEDLDAAVLPELFLGLHLERHPAGVFAAPRARQFVRAALPPLFRRKAVRVFVLRRGENILGLNLSIPGADSLQYWNGGFAAQAAPWSPGSLLFERQIRCCCEEGLAEFDLLRGHETYKAAWATDVRLTHAIELIGVGARTGVPVTICGSAQEVEY